MDERVWLWPEGRHGEHLRVWTPDRTERFAELVPGGFDSTADRDPGRLVDGAETLALEAALPTPLATWLARLCQTSRLRLHLCAGLPKAWYRFPYEWLTLDGQPLHDRLRVWRHVPRTAEPRSPVPPAPVALFNLWPPDEAVQPLADFSLAPAKVHRHDGCRWVEALLRTRDLHAFSALCLIAHGSERADARPFRLPDGSLWELPPAQPLPSLVILLACGDNGGNLLDYAAALLKRGASTVLAALGRLDARDMTALLPILLHGWLTGERIGDALDAAQTAVAWRGRGRLCLLGTGELRMGDAPELADWATDRLAEHARAGEDTALRALLPRLTLDGFLHAGESSQATPRLREYLGIPELGAPTENRSLLERLWPLAKNWPALTRLWVSPLLAHLAEQHDHSHLNDCRRQLVQLARAHPEFAGLYADWAKAEYRRGHYAKAAAATMAGLGSATGTDEISVRLLGLLILILIDLNLPEPGRALLDLRERRLDRLDGAFAEQEQFKDVESRGRLALRRGEHREALAWFRHKRAQAPEHKENGWRELAWLLYAAALVGPIEGDTDYAEECRAILAGHPEPGTGNDPVLYLLRALAAWTWRRGDAAARDALVAWLPELKTRLDGRQDIGPVGFALAYLHLDQRQRGDWSALPAWESVRVGLEEDRYFLELAIFDRLLDRPRPETEAWLTRHHRERRDTLGALTPEKLPDWLRSELPEMWSADVRGRESRESQERDLLLATAPPDWNALIAARLLPW